MFDDMVPVDDQDEVACSDVLAELAVEQRRLGAARLAQVAHWADLHAPGEGTLKRDRVRAGGEGTPEVTRAGVIELGCLLQTTTCSAQRLLADALDLRHRHPRCWAAVMTGRVEDFKARQVARAARRAELSFEQARKVDAAVVDALVGSPWGRALSVLEAAVIDADPVGHQRRREAAAEAQYIATSRRDTETGQRTLLARTAAATIARFVAMVDHIAEVMKAQGDTDCLQLRRVKAFALLADPGAACVLLARGHEPQAGAEAGAERLVSTAYAAAELGRLLLAQGATALARLRPRTVIYLHLSDEALRARSGVGRVEGIAPIDLGSMGELQELIGRDAVTVTPVLDVRDQVPVDAYEVPARMRDAMIVSRPFEVFPWGTHASRSAEMDHTVPYRDPDEVGPPGQTRPDNLGPLSRTHHDAKTHHGFALHQPVPGTYLWRTPTGHWFQVDHTGSHALGRAPVQRRQPRVERLTSPLEIQLAGHLAG